MRPLRYIPVSSRTTHTPAVRTSCEWCRNVHRPHDRHQRCGRIALVAVRHRQCVRRHARLPCVLPAHDLLPWRWCVMFIVSPFSLWSSPVLSCILPECMLLFCCAVFPDAFHRNLSPFPFLALSPVLTRTHLLPILLVGACTAVDSSGACCYGGAVDQCGVCNGTNSCALSGTVALLVNVSVRDLVCPLRLCVCLVSVTCSGWLCRPCPFVLR